MKTAALPAGTGILRLGGHGTSRQRQPLHGLNNNLSVPTEQCQTGGNRCGHNKNVPKFYPAHANINKFPKIIQRAQDLLELAYFDPKKLWRSLNFLDVQQKRSERRESIVLVGQYLNIHNNLKNFTVKSPARDIAYYTGLSLNRVKQALRDLTKAGYIKTTDFIKHCFKGSWYGITAIRQLTDKFYLELGISEHALHSARCWKSGNKMTDSRPDKTYGLALNKIREFIGKTKNAVYSAANFKPFHVSSESNIDKKSTIDLLKPYELDQEIISSLIKIAKEKSEITKEPWFKIYRLLEKEYKSKNPTSNT